MNNADTEKYISQTNDSRLINLAENLIFPLLAEEIRVSTEQMAGKFTNGDDVTIDNAYVAAVIRLREKLISMIRQGDRAKQKLDMNKL